MAKKSSAGGIVLICIFTVIAMITKYWQLFVAIGIVALVIWLIAKMLKSSSTKESGNFATPEVQIEANSKPSPPIAAQNSPQPENTGELSIPSRSSSYTSSIALPNSDDITNYNAGALRKQSASADSLWIQQGRTVEKDGYRIPGGLIYFGKGLKSVRGWESEPALIDLSLIIDWNSPDRTGSKMNYWPSFSELHPSSRAAYLEWLSTGRKNSNANIGYVFLYFYGLERRALADATVSHTARAEVGTILAETKRLLSIYGGIGSFRGYASSFIDILQSSDAKDRLYKNPPTYTLPCYDIPLSIKIALGQMAADGIPLPAEWAFAWIETDPMTSLRTPAQRCKDEFKKLFQIRYTEKFGDGYKLKLNKTKLSMSYRPASASFGGQITTPYNGLYDVTVLKEPISTLRELAESSTNELDAYSRYLGRNAGAKDSIEATALLPQPLLSGHGGKEFEKLSAWLKGLVTSDASIQISFDKLLEHIPTINRDSFGKRVATALAQLLAKIGIGIEPDARFGNLLPKTDQEIMLFRISDHAPTSPSKEYSAATILMHLASAVANADGAITPEEERHMEEHLEAWLHLSPDEKIRLKAHTQWLLSSYPGLNGVKKRLELLNAVQKESIGKFLVRIAQADGYIDPTEIKILTKIYEQLGLDAQNLYSHAHSAAVEPVTVQAADFVKHGYAIPAPALKKNAEGVILNMSSVEAKLAETVAVSALLNNIFTDDESITVQTTPVQESADSAVIPGLDTETSAFMRFLAAKLVWAREELENLAAEKGIMLDGTLDIINDASFDTFGGPFFEGEDPIEINAEIAKEIAG